MFIQSSMISIVDTSSCESKTLEKYYMDMLPPNSTKDLITIIHVNIVSLLKIFDSFTNLLNRFPKAVDA